MFAAILPILINIFLLSRVETIPVINETLCSFTVLNGCDCQNIEVITESSVEWCCKSINRTDKLTLLITGPKVKNISINIADSQCRKNFEILVIRETSIVNFNFPFLGLDNVNKVYIEKNQYLHSFNKLYFSEMSKKIDSIFVEYNILRSIESKTFSNLPILTNLKLTDNKIGFIENRCFSNLTKLSTLDLNNNILTVLSTEMFYGLENLKTLTLLNNFLLELKPDVFKYITNLQYLSLSIGVPPDASQSMILPNKVFFPVKRLKSVRMILRIKDLTSLTFYGLTELENLDLQNNQLTIIPSGTLQQMPKVTSINLSRNAISCLMPETFTSLPALTSLDLSNNEISYISNEVFATLSSLHSLDLAENSIYVIERNAFVGLKSLLILKINLIHGKAKNELQNNWRSSPLAKLRTPTKIMGLYDYFLISSGGGEPAEVLPTPSPVIKGSAESKRNYCPVAASSDRDWLDPGQSGSRKYLLIIIGICVVFLLIAFAIIMSYRAWSKRKMSDLSYNVDIQEKQEMLVNNSNSVNGRIDHNSNKPHSKSNQTRKSINGSYMPDSPVEITETKTDSFASNQPQKPIACPLPNESNHSDDESALTPLGIL